MLRTGWKSPSEKAMLFSRSYLPASRNRRMFPILKSRYIMRKILFLTGILFVAGIAGACHDSESASGRPDGIEVGFALRGVGISASVQPQVRPDSRAAAESLSAGSTVRVAAYKRRASGATADIAQDTYVSEAAYEVQEDGSLKPCAVDSEGKVTSSAGDAMRLSAGAYDFYALTPAFAVCGRPSFGQCRTRYGLRLFAYRCMPGGSAVGDFVADCRVEHVGA